MYNSNAALENSAYQLPPENPGSPVLLHSAQKLGNKNGVEWWSVAVDICPDYCSAEVRSKVSAYMLQAGAACNAEVDVYVTGWSPRCVN